MTKLNRLFVCFTLAFLFAAAAASILFVVVVFVVSRVCFTWISLAGKRLGRIVNFLTANSILFVYYFLLFCARTFVHFACFSLFIGVDDLLRTLRISDISFRFLRRLLLMQNKKKKNEDFFFYFFLFTVPNSAQNYEFYNTNLSLTI